MKKIDRLAELEKLAEKLGIGQNREVVCVSCKKKFQFKDAIILTNKQKVKYLCPTCNEKIEKGDLNKQEQDWQKIIKQIKDSPQRPDITPWQPYYPNIGTGTYPTKIERYKITMSDKTYALSTASVDNQELLKFEPIYTEHANRTSTGTK